MITKSKPSKGVMTDNELTGHNPSFAYESINGRFTEEGNLGVWRSINKFLRSGSLPNETYIGEILFENDTYICTVYDGTTARVYKYDGMDDTITKLWERSNSEMNWNSSYPIHGFIRRNSQGTKLFIYITDNYNTPKAWDLLDSNSQSCSFNELSISQKNGMLFMSLRAVYSGGSLIPGTYYYAVMAYKDTGIATDWFMMPGNVLVPNKIPSNFSSEEFQNVTGGSMSENSNVKVYLILENYTLYAEWKMKVASFLALDEYKLDTGKIFYDGVVTPLITHSSNISYGDVSVEDVGNTTLSIKKIGQMTSNGEIATIADIEIETLPAGTTFDNIKMNNALGIWETYQAITVSLEHASMESGKEDHGIILDNSDDNDIKHFLLDGQKKEAYYTVSMNSRSDVVKYKKVYKKCSDSSVVTKQVRVNSGFMDYSNPMIDFNYKVYRKGESVRLAMLPYDLHGKPTRPIFLGDLTHESTGNTLGCILENGGSYTKNHNGHFFFDDTYKLTSEINYIKIGNVVFNDFVEKVGGVNYPKISGFSIVQAYPSQKRIVMEGLATRVNNPATTKGIFPWCSDEGAAQADMVAGGWLIIHTPELTYEKESIEVGQKVFVTNYVVSNELSAIREHNYTPFEANNYLNKFYKKTSHEISLEGVIEEVYEIPYYPEVEKFTIDGLGEVEGRIGNLTDQSPAHGPRKSYLIKIESGSTLYNHINNNPSDSYITMYNVRIENSSYGFNGQTDTELENTIYEYTGHYVRTDSTFFDNIERVTEDYVTELYVYGGKFRPAIFEICRAIPYCKSSWKGFRSHIVYLPVVTDFNLRMRDGSRHSKDRIIHPSLYGGGLGYSNITGLGLIGQDEEYLFNPSYKSVNNGKEIFPIPLGYEIQSVIKDAVYWSNKVTIHNMPDVLRIFFPGQYKMADGLGGQINALVFIKNRLYIFQKNAVGYLPYMEKTVSSSVQGSTFVMAYGEVFPKYELVEREKGLDSNRLVCEYGNMIFFFSYNDKNLNVVSGDQIDSLNFKMQIDSLLKTRFTQPTRLLVTKREGVVSLNLLRNPHLLDINLTYNMVNGYYNLDKLTSYSIINLGKKLGIRTTESSALNFYYENFDDRFARTLYKLHDKSKLSVILGTEEPDISKIFDVVQINSKEGMIPTEIKYDTRFKNITETVVEGFNMNTDGSILTINAPFFDITNDFERVRDCFVLILTIISNTDCLVNSVLSNYRKKY